MIQRPEVPEFRTPPCLILSTILHHDRQNLHYVFAATSPAPLATAGRYAQHFAPEAYNWQRHMIDHLLYMYSSSDSWVQEDELSFRQVSQCELYNTDQLYLANRSKWISPLLICPFLSLLFGDQKKTLGSHLSHNGFDRGSMVLRLIRIRLSLPTSFWKS